MTGDPKWHERTPTLLAASVAALTAIGLVVWLTMFVVRQVNTTEPAPLEYVAPFVDGPSSTTSTTTGTTAGTSGATSTRPVETTDISDVIGPSSSSETSSSERPTRTPRSRANDDDDDEDETTTTRRRARQNETRTLYPQP